MQPLSFTAGKKVGFMEKTAGESAGGLFSGQSGPKPPPALSVAVLGMKPGGKRSVGQIATVRLLLQEMDRRNHTVKLAGADTRRENSFYYRCWCHRNSRMGNRGTWRYQPMQASSCA